MYKRGGKMATVLRLKILDNGDQLKSECVTVAGQDFVTVEYYREDELLAIHEYHNKEPLIRVMQDIEAFFAVIV